MGQQLNQFIRRVKLPYLAAGIIVVLFLLLIGLKTHDSRLQTASSPSFTHAPAFSGWAYQTTHTGMLQVAAKTTGQTGSVNVKVDKTAVTFDTPVAINQLKQTSANTLAYTSKKKDTEITYQITPQTLKENIILNTPPTSPSFTIPLRLANAKIVLNANNQPIIIDDKTNKYMMHFETPYAVDAAGKATYAVTYRLESTNKIPQTYSYPETPGTKVLLANLHAITQPPKQYRLILTVDPSWLNDPKRVYPITIDPTVVHDTTSEFAAGQLNRMKDTLSNSAPIAQATGGTITYVNGYTIHTFTASGTFTPSTAMDVEVLVVGGGGAGGGYSGGCGCFNGAGGGGGGGISTGTISATQNSTVNITVGLGGTISTGIGNAGSPSTISGSGISTITANGGNGGGVTTSSTGGAAGTGGTSSGGATNTTGAIGGVGGWNSNGYNGTNGTTSFLSGTTTYYGSGGGGASGFTGGGGGTAGVGGVNAATGGVGTSSSSDNGDNAPNNYGGGGGGGYGPSGTGGAGGSGIVIVRYPNVYSDLVPSLSSYYQELTADQYTVGLWHMYEASGTTTVADSSGNSNTGTSASSANITTTGILGNARVFNGSSDNIGLASSTNANVVGDISIEMWLNPNSFASNMTPIHKEAQYTIQFDTSGNFYWADSSNYSYTNFGATNIGLVTGKWQHLAVTKSGGMVNVYLNGELKASKIFGGAITSTSNIMRLGCFASASACSSQYFNGSMDEVRISNIARSPEEIKLDATRRPYSVYTSNVIDTSEPVSIWNSFSWNGLGMATGDGETATTSAQSALVAQWNFNETSGTTAVSGGTCGASCNGTLTNMTTTGQDAAVNSGWTATNRRWGTGALMFDGSSNYIDAGNNSSLDPTSALTVEAWIKPTNFPTFSGYQTSQIISKGTTDQTAGHYGLKINNNQAYFSIYQGGAFTNAISSTHIYTGNWYHLVGTWDGTTMSIYVNGILQGSAPLSGPITANSGNLQIGRLGTSGYEYYFQGVIDATRIYNRALTTAEVLSNYNSSRIELQTRVGSSADPNDGTWEAWKPTTTETQLNSLDADAANWSWDSTATYMPKAKTDDSITKQEGTGSLKLTSGIPQADANTVGLWHLDETGGTGAYLKDSSGNNNHGTPTGTATTDGAAGKARSFNGSSDYIPTSCTTGLSTAITIEAWIKPSSVSIVQAIAGKRSGTANSWAFYARPTGQLGFTLNGTADYISSAANLVANRWQHVAATVNGTALVIYVNGVSVYSTTMGASIASDTQPFGIGSTQGASVINPFSGSIDEVKLSKVTRTAEEIAEDYRMGRDHRLSETITSTDLSSATKLPFYVAADRLGTFSQLTVGESAFANDEPDANTVGLWHLDEQSGSGAYLKDASGNNNHGTPTGATFIQGKIGQGRYINGTDTSYISIPNNDTLNANTAISVSLWFKAPTVGANYRGLIGKNTIDDWNNSRAWSFNFPGNGTLLFAIGTGKASTTNAYDDDKWHYLVGTWSGGLPKIYVDGIETAYSSQVSVASVTDSSSPLLLGDYAHQDGQNRHLIGSLDEVRIDNIARSADEIRQTYEVGARTHNITIDFKAKLNSGNLIVNSSDVSFTVDETPYGSSAMANHLFLGDKIIIKENYDGTEYLAQGTVNSVNTSTGAVTVAAWDLGSTFPASGFSVNATVFKWQREYFDLTGSLASHRDAITRLTYRITNGSLGTNIWLDDLRSSTGYLSNPLGSAITSSLGHQYFQYRAIETSTDPAVSAALTSVTLDYTGNQAPTAPSLETSYQTNKIKTSDPTPEFRFDATDSENNDLVYEVQWDTNASFSAPTSKASNVDAGFADTTTPTDTSPFTAGNSISYTIQSDLTNNTTYFYRVRAKDPSGSNTWSSWSTVKSLTIDTSLSHNQWFETHADQFTSDALTGNAVVASETNDVRVTNSTNTVDLMEYSSDTNAQTAYVTNALSATGGTETTSGIYRIHTFTTSGTLSVVNGGNVEVLVVAAGGSGGNGGGGGGGGGIVYNSTFAVSSGDISTTVGAGVASANGGNSVFSTLTAIGGGKGGDGQTNGNAGGCGGGAGYAEPSIDRGGGTGSQGYGGGNAYWIRSDEQNSGGGGGGGMGAAGGDSNQTWLGGNGGTGIAYSISGTNTYYGGGGGGVSGGNGVSGGSGGVGGGGAGASDQYTSGIAGTANTGGGGGGGRGASGGTGGSGIVIVRYPDNTLQSYSESSIKTEGSYALKGVAKATNALNQTLTRTIASPIDLSNKNTLSFDMRASRTGSNIKIGLHDSGGTTTEITPSITTADSFQSVTWDISGVSNADKDAVDKVIISITNADVDNTFYIDNFAYTDSGSGSITSTPITAVNIHTASYWHSLTYTDEATADISYQILYDNAGTPTLIPDSDLPGNSTGLTGNSPISLTTLSTAAYPTIYLRANLADDLGTAILSDWGASVNTVPTVPTLDIPTNTTTIDQLFPTLQTTSTDTDNDILQYKIILCTDINMTANCQTFDQTTSTTGWSAASYASGIQASYTLQSALNPSTTYYWKTSATDAVVWSGTQPSPYSFTTPAVPPPATGCRIRESGTDASATIMWADNADSETGYEIQRSVDGGAFSILQSLGVNTVTYTDTTTSSGHTYSYRIAPYFAGPIYGNWCTTDTLTFQPGTTSLNGIKLNGIQIK